MSPSGFLVQLFQRGVTLRLSHDRARIVAPRTRLTPEWRERLAQDKSEFLQLLGLVDEYRTLVRNAFAIMVNHASPHTGLDVFADDQARLTDELGPTLATVIRDDEARRWRKGTGLCPICGEDGACDVCRDTSEEDSAD